MDDRVHAEGAEAASVAPLFISYATADRKQALTVCSELERRGASCWISSRDVAPGANYQEAIVRALRSAPAMVLIFSSAANVSDEIKKELSLASRYQVPVIALRIEDVEPSDAFAYELSTRQWIDAFRGWDTSIDSLAQRIAQLSDRDPPTATASAIQARASSTPARITSFRIGAALLLPLFAGFAWIALRSSPESAHSMVVRLSEIRTLSADLPPAMPDLVREEIIAAFGDDGVIRISTASAPAAGDGPAYLLGATVRRDGAKIRVITRLTNERSGTTLWTDSFDYDGTDAARVPRRIAVDAGNMVHCGLFAVSTYHESLPDAVMSDYMQFCQNSWWSQSFSNPEKALDAARKVVAGAPDFSWGWSAITVASSLVFFQNEPGAHREEVRRLGLDAADKALSLDPRNGEAFAQKSLLVGRSNWALQEELLKKAIAARPLFCGCEHYLYGVMLANVGRRSDSVDQMRRSTEMLALDGISQIGLAEALVVTGNLAEAGAHFRAAANLFRDPDTSAYIAANYAPETADYAAGLKALGGQGLHMSSAKREAIRGAFQAMMSGDANAKSRAADAVIALSENEWDSLTTRLLGALGAHQAALRRVQASAAKEGFAATSLLWYPSMRGAIRDPEFARVADRLGLLKYWRATHTKPDACIASDAPAFCAAI